MRRIFISHSSGDNAAATAVKTRLAEHGYRSVFLDFDPTDGIPAGREWERELYQRIRSCEAMVVICSRRSISSPWCFVEITHARSLGKPLFTIRIDDAELPGALSDRQIIDWRRGEAEGYERLFAGLRDVGLDPNQIFDWDPKHPPYPGLLAFQETDAGVYFGRSDEIAQGLNLLNRVHHLGDPSAVMILGASGTGKSSLVRAGLIPRLRRDSERWLVLDPIRPRSSPIGATAEVLAAAFGRAGRPRSSQELAQSLAAGGDALTKLLLELRQSARNGAVKVFLAIDQFEELLGRDGVESNLFLSMLRHAAEHQEAPAVVLGTMRSDFLELFQNSTPLLDIRHEVLSLGPMSAADVAEVIEAPARVAEIELQPELAKELAAETQTTNALPLLAFTLRELWERYADDRKLTLDEYRELGGLRMVVGRAAEDVLTASRLTRDDERSLRAAFMAMVRVTDDEKYARRTVRWTDLPAANHPLLERFVRARLLVSGGDGNTRTLEVAHERLFESWDRLRGWIVENREALHLRRDIEDATRAWSEANEPHEYLWRGARVTRAHELIADGTLLLDGGERRFLAVSESVQQSRQRRFIAIAAAAVTVIAALAIAAGIAALRARSSARTAEERARVADLTRARALSAQNFAENQRVIARAQAADADEQKALLAIAPKYLKQSRRYEQEARTLEKALAAWRKKQGVAAAVPDALFTIETLQAGVGSSFLVHYGKPADPQHILIDGGGPGTLKKVLQPRLEELRARHSGQPVPLRLVVSSQTDWDHIKGVIDLVDRLRSGRAGAPYKAEALWTNLLAPPQQELAESLAKNEQKLRVLTGARALGIPINAPFTRQVAAPEAGAARITWNDGFTITVLGPRVRALREFADWWLKNQRERLRRRDTERELVAALAGTDYNVVENFANSEIELLPSPIEIVSGEGGGTDRSVANLASIVLMFELGGKRILLPADARSDYIASALAQAGYTDERGHVEVDVLVLPHGGSDRNVSVGFFRTVKASHYIASSNGMYHRNPEVKTFDMLFEARRDDSRPFTIALTYPPEAMATDYPAAELCALFARERRKKTPFTVITPAKGKTSFGIDLWSSAAFVDKGSRDSICGW